MDWAVPGREGQPRAGNSAGHMPAPGQGSKAFLKDWSGEAGEQHLSTQSDRDIPEQDSTEINMGRNQEQTDDTP